VQNSLFVAKFGGSSIATTERLGRIVAIVKADPRIKYVVVSAPGKAGKDDQKVTDLLLLAHQEVRSGVPFEHTFAIIGDKFRRLATGTGFDVNSELNVIQEGIAHGGTRDWVASRGEYLSAKIAASALGFAFVDATALIAFTPEGRIDETRTWKQIKTTLNRPAVIPGFYGAHWEGTIKTFPRGGSDITGAHIAAAVQASAYLNYTDVPGFLTADPAMVSGTLQIPRLTFREVRELSSAGANVLHAETIFPVRAAGIPIRVLSTFEPERGGTTVSPDNTLEQNPRSITGIAGRPSFTRITLQKAGMNEERGFGQRVLAVLANHEVSVEHMPSSVDSLSIVIAESELTGKIDSVRRSLQIDCKPDDLEVAREEMALVAVVGKSATTSESVLKMVSALDTACVPIKMINLGSSKLSMIIGVENNSFKRALQRLHEAFCRD